VAATEALTTASRALAQADADATTAATGARETAAAVQRVAKALADSQAADAQRDPRGARAAALTGRPVPASGATVALAVELESLEEARDAAVDAAAVATRKASEARSEVGRLTRAQWALELAAAADRHARALLEAQRSAAIVLDLQRDVRAHDVCRTAQPLAHAPEFWEAQRDALAVRLREAGVDLAPQRTRLRFHPAATLKLGRRAVYADDAGRLFSDEAGNLPLDTTVADIASAPDLNPPPGERPSRLVPDPAAAVLVAASSSQSGR
jgi:hypothetical protein